MYTNEWYVSESGFCVHVLRHIIVKISHIGNEDKLSMATRETIEPYQQGKEDWTSYTERLKQYFAVNDVPTAVLAVCNTA